MSTLAYLSDYKHINNKLNKVTYVDDREQRVSVTDKEYIKAYISILTDQIERGIQ